MFTELVHVVPTLNDFLGSPMCGKGSDYMEEGKREKKLQEGEKHTREFYWLCLLLRKERANKCSQLEVAFCL